MTASLHAKVGITRVIQYCCDSFQPASEWESVVGYPDSLALAVIDAIWSMTTRYPITRGVIRRYIQHRAAESGDASRDGLTDLLGFYERIGGVDSFIDVVGTRNLVSTQPNAVRKVRLFSTLLPSSANSVSIPLASSSMVTVPILATEPETRGFRFPDKDRESRGGTSACC